MKHSVLLLAGLFSFLLSFSQPLYRQQPYHIETDTLLYTVGYAHLDTEWNWDYPATINHWIPNILHENFNLFEKYPDYVFNFTGSRRYQMMKEYYPELFKKLGQYIKAGRWHVSGSSAEEGEVNMSSSESLIRQVLYGNNFFRKEFGVESRDYMLPDCFGFLANMPSIWAHCGLLGFSTQKLTWHSAAGIPFNVGVWNGPDGKGIVAALNATDYDGNVEHRLDIDSAWNVRLSDDGKKYGIHFDYRYYGVGDQGGAPREKDVKNAIGSLNHTDSKLRVILTSSDQMFKDITPALRSKLPVYTGDLLLIEHSAGSLTSEAYMKRLSRKNELLAQSAEELAAVADGLGVSAYPQDKLNNAWNLVLGSQFHDILPGTAIPKAYEYAWNDEGIAANGFAQVLTNAAGAITTGLNTQGTGRSLVVYNPVAKEREDVVAAELDYAAFPGSIQVVDAAGKTVPSQVLEWKQNHLRFIFQAKLPSAGLAVYEIRQGSDKKTEANELTVTTQSLENKYYKVTIGSNGDILSVFDKQAQKEILAHPATLEFLHEHPNDWPAWNMDWSDRQKPAISHLDKNATITVLEQGPVRVALEIKREGRNSYIDQVLSLASGDAGKHLEVDNKLDWQSKGVSLKASFPLTVSNEKATYNLGVGTLERGNNNPVKYEVPSKQWFDLTDQSGNYGVSILEDCKFGSDKPDNNTLRLTLMYTPEANYFVYQGTQDWGVHHFRYGIYGHQEDWRKAQSQWQAQFFNQPLIAFETPKHPGKLGKSLSLVTINNPQVGLMAFKKMETGGYYLLRVNELNGQDTKAIQVQLPGKITDAYEVNGQEQKIGTADFTNGKLNFDLTHYTIRSFAVKFEPQSAGITKPVEQAVVLPYNQDMMSFDDNRDDCSTGTSLPAELVPDTIVSEDIHFVMGSKEDGKNNAVSCNHQKISLPVGDYDKLYILAAATDNTTGDFEVDGEKVSVQVQKNAGFVSQFYNREFTADFKGVTKINDPYSRQDNIAWFASHRHLAYPSENDAYQYTYLFKYLLKIPKGAKTLVLPDNKKISVFAITVGGNEYDDIKVMGPLYDDFKGDPHEVLRN